ncbi:hypothetical protein HYPSUDRAFT_205320 [Hypholoma sublateritium FD-334 SS-4]|uniref:Nephrocystin 3-like N-terminal domain-containing protein n=1 Tax=Hypholoma sublateritium (strain FD-334 SS-4) TaxID=945553 RepID=A0A0D2KUW8_HYPSF|nr:hypothetical protein HYPSUDRAFT_205320 [Hypholoma sublateritium FD-334 SS-4]
MDWTKDSGVAEHMLWVHGPSFTHTIAHAVANLQEQEHATLVTYFVGRTPDNEDVRARFISTITYQLCLSFPKLREEIGAAVAHDPVVLLRSVARQLDSLILQPLAPFLSVSDSMGGVRHHPVVIIVDGCDSLDDFTRTCVINALFKLARQFPLRVRILLFTESSSGVSAPLTSGVDDGSVIEISFGAERPQVDNQARQYLPFTLGAIIEQVWNTVNIPVGTSVQSGMAGFKSSSPHTRDCSWELSID